MSELEVSCTQEGWVGLVSYSFSFKSQKERLLVKPSMLKKRQPGLWVGHTEFLGLGSTLFKQPPWVILMSLLLPCAHCK